MEIESAKFSPPKAFPSTIRTTSIRNACTENGRLNGQLRISRTFESTLFELKDGIAVRLNGVTVETSGLIAPPLHSFHGGARQNEIAVHHTDIMDRAVRPNTKAHFDGS